jgi:hypothetical protein
MMVRPSSPLYSGRSGEEQKEEEELKGIGFFDSSMDKKKCKIY